MRKMVLLLGASGLIGSAIYECLKEDYNVLVPSSNELDLTNERAVNQYFCEKSPKYVILSAAYKSGVGEYSKHPVEYLNVNLSIQNNVITKCYDYNVDRLVFLGASSIYPSSVDMVVREDFFKTGWVQMGTEPYSLAKAVGTRLCDYYNSEYGTNYVTAALSNVYGWSNSHYDQTSVIPALIDRFQCAVEEKKEEVEIWGTGENKREFLYVKDCAEAIKILLESDVKGLINIGSGCVVSINELANTISQIVGFKGIITHDMTKANGSQRSVLDISKIKDLGWCPKYSLWDGLSEMIQLKKLAE